MRHLHSSLSSFWTVGIRISAGTLAPVAHSTEAYAAFIASRTSRGRESLVAGCEVRTCGEPLAGREECPDDEAVVLCNEGGAYNPPEDAGEYTRWA